jgi:hypothetical protein
LPRHGQTAENPLCYRHQWTAPIEKWTVDDGVWMMYDDHMMNRMATERRSTMHDEVTIEVHTLRGESYTARISEELKNLIMKELEFGVNLPIDQEFKLRATVICHHIV